MTTALTEDEFYERFRQFLGDRRPDLPADVAPTTQLWEAGYLDSFGLIETLGMLEELVGHPIEIGADDLPSFFTMAAVYGAFVAADGSTGAAVAGAKAEPARG